ncbi:hypothetical protein GCM10009611_09530 [Arthrobacter roseus]
MWFFSNRQAVVPDDLIRISYRWIPVRLVSHSTEASGQAHWRVTRFLLKALSQGLVRAPFGLT